MRDTLYIHLRHSAADTPVAFVRVSGEPGPSLAVEQERLDAVLERAAGCRIVLFVPAADVRLATVQVPARQPQKILQAAPYALEDQLAEDIDTLHFAIARGTGRAPGEPHPVAVVSRECMDGWLAPFTSRQLQLDAVIPETLALPLPPPGHWSGVADAGGITVRSGAFAGFSCPLADLETYLQLLDTQGAAPLRLFVSPGVDYDFTRLQRPVELMPGQGVLATLVRNLRESDAINLLQGHYSQKTEWQGFGRPWRVAGGLAAAWVLLALLLQGVTGFRDVAELRRLEQANIERWKMLFPEATQFGNLGLQAQQQLALLRGGGSAAAPLLELLDTLAASLNATPGLSLKSMQFREGSLYLGMTGNDLQALESLRGWYASRPGTVLSVQDTNASPDGVQIRLKLTPA